MSKILLIENDLLTIRLYKKVFTSENYDLEVAFTEEEGLQKAKDGKPLVILLDVMNPQDKRFQVLEKLKHDPETKHFPVVVMANISDKAFIATALAKGASRYIDKFEHNPQQIVKIVKETIVSTTSSY